MCDTISAINSDCLKLFHPSCSGISNGKMCENTRRKRDSSYASNRLGKLCPSPLVMRLHNVIAFHLSDDRIIRQVISVGDSAYSLRRDYVNI